MAIGRSLGGIVLALALVLGAGVQSASALSVGAGGVVTGWGVTPFTFAGAPGSTLTANGITAFYQNNWSPISYPGVAAHTPSPGGASGEAFDLEEMYVRQSPTNANIVQMLLVSSSALSSTVSGFKLGDILLDSDNNGTYDMGLVTQSANTGGTLTADRLYYNITTQRLQNLSGSYYNTATEALIGPWAVAAASAANYDHAIAAIPIETTSYNYGGIESPTYLTQFSFDISHFTLPQTFGFHLDWGCGNDVIAGTFTVSPPPKAPGGGGVPEPATASMALLGLGSLGLALKRSRR